MKTNSHVLVLSGPSGCGKSTLTKVLLENIPNVYFSISTTTRPKRDGEIEGVHYHFTDKDTFLQDLKDGKFLESEEVYGNHYGTSLAPILRAIEEGKLVIFDVDVKGHDSIKRYFGASAKSIFITTKDITILESRLRNRQSDTDATIKRRLNNALDEMKHISKFDYLIINDDINDAKKAILSIVDSLYFLNNEHKSNTLIKTWK